MVHCCEGADAEMHDGVGGPGGGGRGVAVPRPEAVDGVVFGLHCVVGVVGAAVADGSGEEAG